MISNVDKTASIKFCLLLITLLFSSDIFLLLTSNMKNNILSLKSDDLQSNIGILFTFLVFFSVLVAFISKFIASILILLFSYKRKKTIKQKIKSKKYMRTYKIKNKAILNNNSTLYQFILKNEENKNNYFLIMSLYIVMSILLSIDVRTENSIVHNFMLSLSHNYSQYLFGASGLILMFLVTSVPILLALIYNDDNGYVFMNRSLFRKLYKYNKSNA